MNPTLQAGKQIPPSDYVATFVISKSGILSPLKQFKSGIKVQDVTCKKDYTLIIKKENNSPACVKPQTAQKLVDRGWAQPIVGTKSLNAQ